MTIAYDVTPADAHAWHCYYVKLPSVVQLFRRQGFLVAWLSGGMMTVLFLATSRDVRVSAIAGLVTFTVMWALMSFLIPRQTVRRADRALNATKASPTLGQHTLEAGPQSITETGDYYALTVRWEAVKFVERADDYLFILLHTQSSIIVPLRFLPSVEAQDEFVKTMKDWFTAARKESEASSPA